jgi:excisionase family DNA binding protein
MDKGKQRTVKSADLPKYQQPIEYLTRKEVAKVLNISLVTADKWAAIGLLKSYRLASRIYFKRHEIDAAMSLIPSKKGGANG